MYCHIYTLWLLLTCCASYRALTLMLSKSFCLQLPSTASIQEGLFWGELPAYWRPEKRLRHQQLSAHQKSTHWLTSVWLPNFKREMLFIQPFSSHLIHRRPQTDARNANASSLCAVNGWCNGNGCVSPHPTSLVGCFFYIFKKDHVTVQGTWPLELYSWLWSCISFLFFRFVFLNIYCHNLQGSLFSKSN